MLRWPDATVYQALSEVATDRPDAPALHFERATHTYADLLDEARALAGGLADLGVESGDTVAVWLGNRPAWLVAQLAASALGAATIAVNTRYRAHELDYLLRDAAPRVLLTEGPFLGRDQLATVTELAPGLATATPDGFAPAAYPALTDVVTIDPAPDSPAARVYDDVLATGRAVPIEPATDPASPACVFYTSGTTSDPKGCPQTERSLLNHSHQVGVHLGLRSDDVALGVLPFPGVWGHNVALSALTHGLPLVCQSHFDAGTTLDLIERHGVTYWSALATMASRVVDHETFSTDRVTTLRRGAVGFLSMGYAPDVFDELEAALGFPLVQPYGLSEANSQVFVGDPTATRERRRRVGGPLVHPEEESARVVDPETGEPCPTGEAGELLLAGYNVIEGYLGKPAATADSFTDGWLHTGDLAVHHADGAYTFESRLDDALRTRGFLVTPREIERVLDGLPGVAASQVVGVPHPRHGQVPVAFVVGEAGLTERAVREALEGRVADYKVPAAVRFVESFPRSAGPHGEKVRKGELREQVVDLFDDG